MNPHVRLLDGLSYFPERVGKLHFHSPSGYFFSFKQAEPVYEELYGGGGRARHFSSNYPSSAANKIKKPPRLPDRPPNLAAIQPQPVKLGNRLLR